MEEIALTRRSKRRLQRALPGMMWWHIHSYPEIAIALFAARNAFHLQGYRPLLAEGLTAHLRKLASHSGSSALVRNAFAVPKYWRPKTRRGSLRTTLESDTLTRAIVSACAMMGAIGHIPLIERWSNEPRIWSHVLGDECEAYGSSRYKLFGAAANVHPHLPFGPSLFDEKGENQEAVCPDIVAFVFLEVEDDISHIGPNCYGVDEIEGRLEKGDIDHLRERHFAIDPDPGVMGEQADNGFGGAVLVNILGRRNNKHKYLRLDIERMRDTYGHPGLMHRLKHAVDHLKRKKTPLDAARGDILFVNNRRTATEWPRHGVRSGMIRDKWNALRYPKSPDRWPKRKLEEKDRIIIRISFYSPKNIADVQKDTPAALAKSA